MACRPSESSGWCSCLSGSCTWRPPTTDTLRCGTPTQPPSLRGSSLPTATSPSTNSPTLPAPEKSKPTACRGSSNGTAVWSATVRRASSSSRFLSTGWRHQTAPTRACILRWLPAAVAAATAAALAVGLLAVGFRKLTANTVAVAAALVFGLGTATWSVSADALYQHGPNQLWLAAAMVLTSQRSDMLASGLMYGAAMFTRGTTGIAAAVTGIYLSWRTRSVRPALLIGFVSALGLAGLLWYNAVMFRNPSPVGGYGDYVVEYLVGSKLLDYAKNSLRHALQPRTGSAVVVAFRAGFAAGATSRVEDSASLGARRCPVRCRIPPLAGAGQLLHGRQRLLLLPSLP